jgi:uncharacterized protein (UPF0335 family)
MLETESENAGIGHNSGTSEVEPIAQDRLRSLVERVEALADERDAISSDIRDIFTEAKSAGFDVKTLRALIRVRRMDAADVEEQEMMLQLYKRTMGM